MEIKPGECWGHKTIPDMVRKQKTVYKLDVAKISFLKSEIALVHGTWEWPGFMQSPGQEPVDRKGIITMVMIKQEGKWLVRASQNTRVL